ncbi:MAG: hypothetical protein R2822_10000 [Spirosomataceae bacterium]
MKKEKKSREGAVGDWRLVIYGRLFIYLLLTAYGLLPFASIAQRCSVVQYDSTLAQRYPFWRLKRAMLEDSIQQFLRFPQRSNARSECFMR